ncbi:MAG: LCP family protein [Bifidobacteriaceae bacterium]|jgi:LCP family protein required for cell wall assembly|nr:LCP family protein [Bifidobacteriaceae bacterium]
MVAALALAATAAVGERIRQLDANITTLDRVKELVGMDDRPSDRATTTAEAAPLDPFGGRPVNILITAIDSREGENADVVGDSMETLLNDVNMVAHISADRSRVDVVAIPRDTLVEMPSCPRADGTSSPARSSVMINEAFGTGARNDVSAKDEGVSCVIKTVEAVTGIRLNTFILVEFAGFANVVNALDGVDICVPEGLIGKKSHIDLEPGQHHLDGKTALAYARTREGKTYAGERLDGSDTTRISRQQELMATVINEVLNSGKLQSLGTINSTATAVTKALSVGEEIGSVMDIAGLAYALRQIKMENVSLFTAPWVPAPEDPDRVKLATWGNPDKFGGLTAAEIFELIARDQPVPGTTPYKVANPDAAEQGPSASAGASAAASADPTGDGTGTPGGGSATPPADDDFITPLTAPVTCAVAGQGDDG